MAAAKKQSHRPSRWIVDECLSRTAVALADSADRLFAADGATRQADLNNERMRQQMAAHRKLLTRLNAT